MDEALSHMSRARSREFDRMLWLSSPSTHVHPFASSVLTLTCDLDALVQPNPLWSAWALNALMDEADHDIGEGNMAVPTKSHMFFQNVDSKQNGKKDDPEKTENCSEDLHDLTSSDVYSAEVFGSLMKCALTPNMALKEILFRLCDRILSKVLRALEEDTDILSLQEIHQYLSSCRHSQLIRVFSTRLRKEYSMGATALTTSAAAAAVAAVTSATSSDSSDTTVLSGIGAVHSSYLHVLSSLLIRCDRLRAHTLGDHHRRGMLRYRTLGSTNSTKNSAQNSNNNANELEESGNGMPELFLDDVTSTSITIGWWLNPQWVNALSDRETSIEIQVEMAQIVFDDHPDRLSGLSSLEYNPVRNATITPIVEYYTNPITGITGPRTISTMVCHDLDPDSRYVFRLTGTTTIEAANSAHNNLATDDKHEGDDNNSKDDSAAKIMKNDKGEEEKNETNKEDKDLKTYSALDNSSNSSKKKDSDATSIAPTVSFGLISSAAAAALQPLRRSNALTVETLSEMLFMLDPASCGSNLVLSSANLIVTNTMNKKWNAVRATASFSSGIHSWEVHIDKCVSKNIFVGVISAMGSADNYVGSDRYGWGYLANKAIWHNKGKMRSYGELFRQGDTIGVRLDMDVGTLSFCRNGKDLGVAVEGLVGDMYPAFSLYNQDDQLSLVAGGRVKGRSTQNSKSHLSNFGAMDETDEKTLHDQMRSSDFIGTSHGGSGRNGGGGVHSEGSSARRKLSRLNKSLQLFSSLLSATSATTKNSMPEEVTIDELETFLTTWKGNEMERAVTSDGDVIVLNGNECSRFGYRRGDILCGSKGDVCVVGVAHGMLWTRTWISAAAAALANDATIALSKTEKKKKAVPSPATAAMASVTISLNSATAASSTTPLSAADSTTTKMHTNDSKNDEEDRNKDISSSIPYVVQPWTRKAMRELRLTAPPLISSHKSGVKSIVGLVGNNNDDDGDNKMRSQSNNNNNNNNNKNNNDDVSSEKNHQNGKSDRVNTTSSSMLSSAKNMNNKKTANSTTQGGGNGSSFLSPAQWWSNDNAFDDAIVITLNQLTMWTSSERRTTSTAKYSGAHPWSLNEQQVKDTLISKDVKTTDRLMLRILAIVYANHLLEGVLPFIELWRDGTSLSASGWTPIASSSGASTNSDGWCSQPWSHGAMLVRSKHLIMTATKYRFLCMLMSKTCTMQALHGISDMKKKIAQLMIIEKSTIEIYAIDTSPLSIKLNAMNKNSENTYFAQCCQLFKTLPTTALRYGDGTMESYCVRVRFKTHPHHAIDAVKNIAASATVAAAAAAAAAAAHVSSIQGQDHLHDWRSYQCELFRHVATELNQEHTSLFVHGYGSTDSNILLVPSTTSTLTIKFSVADKNSFKTLGWMLGIALRTRTWFHICFAPLVWKLLVDPTRTMSLEDVQPLDIGGALEYLNSQEGAASELVKKTLKTDVEEKPRDVQERVLSVRLGRAKEAVSYIRSGLLDIIPGHSLVLFTWNEIQSIFGKKK